MSIREWVKFGLLGIVWGSSFLWIKIAIHELGPFTLVTLRVLFAVLGILAVIAWRHPALKMRSYWGVFFLLGLFNTAVPFTLISFSEQYISSGLASILNSTVPLFTILIAPLFLKDDPFTLPKALGLLMGFGGVVVLMSSQVNGAVNDQLVGMGAMLLAAFFYAASGVFARRKTQGLTPEAQTLGQMIMGFAIILPAALSLEAPFTLPRLPLTWVALAWLGLLGTAAGTLIYYSLLHSVGPTRTLLVTYLFPLVGVFLGIVFLGEALVWQQVLGGAMIISGIGIVNQLGARSHTPGGGLRDRIIVGIQPPRGDTKP